MLFIPYRLGNFCFHFILERLVSCAHHSLATFLLGPSACFFCLKCLLCASLALPSFGATLSLPIQLGAPFWSIIGLYCPYSNLVGIFSTRRLSLCRFILGISSGAPLCWFPSIYTPACWSYLLDVFPSFAHLLWASSQSYYFIIPLCSCSSWLELSFRHISSFCPLVWALLVWFFRALEWFSWLL